MNSSFLINSLGLTLHCQRNVERTIKCGHPACHSANLVPKMCLSGCRASGAEFPGQKHGAKTDCFSAWRLSRLVLFAVETKAKVGYVTAAPQGVEVRRSLKTSDQQSAISRGISRLQPSADWDWVTQGLPKRLPRVTQGSPKRHARVDLGKCLCLQ